jgi:aconitate hydratase
LVTRVPGKVYLVNQTRMVPVNDRGAMADCIQAYGLDPSEFDAAKARQGTIAYHILQSHNTGDDMEHLRIRFDSIASHDITYVGIIQTARASGMTRFPLPYVLTNCHNSLCAVGGTINEDDHVFGLSAARKYGGIFVPAHQAVIHQYMREMMAGCGRMILGSDSHTRYGALGTMAIGEGGPELVKQLLERTYDIAYPEVVLVYLTGTPKAGVGPQDVALALIGEVFSDGFVKNRVLEFAGPGIANLSADYRIGIDVMTTETTCLSSIWQTDETIREYFRTHGREDAYRELNPAGISLYDRAVVIDLDKIEPMIAMPFHPSNAMPIRELLEKPNEIMAEYEAKAMEQLSHTSISTGGLTGKVIGGRIRVDQGVIAGCAGGTYEDICLAANILSGKHAGDFPLSVYPASQPIHMELNRTGVINELMAAGVTVRSAFCGPCFGAGDVPAHNAFSIRHTTRNFPNREGSKPGEGQIAWVGLMDARSIAATAANGGWLTPATEVNVPASVEAYHFDPRAYESRVYNGVGNAQPDLPLICGPNIKDWPPMIPMPENLLLRVASVITDPVTTTDELIPSGETSSYRSNPQRLAEYALSRKDPGYVGRAKAIQAQEALRQRMLEGEPVDTEDIVNDPYLYKLAREEGDVTQWLKKTGLGSVIYANKPGDGSAREQAASCQKVLGGWANVALEYATKRYRSNVINWGMIPFTVDEMPELDTDTYLYLPGIAQAIRKGASSVQGYLWGANRIPVTLKMENLSKDERDVILAGCLMNYYRQGK